MGSEQIHPWLKDGEASLIEEQVNQIVNFPATQEVDINGIKQKRLVVLAGDWNPSAVNIAQEISSQNLVDRFIANSEKTRTYRPEDVIVGDEVRALRPLLGEDTVHLLKTFNRTEMYIQDYTRHGLEVISNSPARVSLMLRWGFEESRHQRLLTGGMLEAGIMDHVVKNRLVEDVFRLGWDISKHGNLGKKDLLFYPFGIDQETETVQNYLDLWHRITRDYNQIPLEEARNIKIIDPTQQRGFQRIVSTIYKDEAAHKAGYENIVLMLLKFQPLEVLSLVKEAHEDFVMPVVDRMPTVAVRAAKILYGSPDDTDSRSYREAAKQSYRENFEALNMKLGLDNSNDLETAIENAKSLSNGTRRFEVWLPNGTFQEVTKAA